MRYYSRIVWGLLLVLVGILMLLDRFHYIVFDLGDFLHTWWPLILIIIGLGIVFDHDGERRTR